jgi:hypothetical protein
MIDNPAPPDESNQPSPNPAPAAAAGPAKPADLEEHPLGIAVNTFIRDIDSLSTTLPLAMLIIREANRRSTKALRDYEEENCRVEADGSKRTVFLTPDTQHQFSKLLRRYERGARASSLVPRSFVVSLVSQFDALVGALIRELLLLQPSKLQASQRTLTFSDLVQFGSLEAARDHILEKEVESVLRQSHSEQFEWLERQFSITLRPDEATWHRFIELTERRNLFVHTSGQVSGQYLSVCKKHGVPVDKGITRGTELRANGAYLRDAHRCIAELGIKLAHSLWRKVAPQDRKAADTNLIAVTFDLISDEQYDLAARLLDYATETIPKFASESNRRTLIINRAQAYKWKGDQKRALAILEKEDWSASADRFRLCAAALRDDFAESIAMMRRIGTSGELRKSEYRDWPVFRKLREEASFQQAFTEVFGEALVIPRTRSDVSVLNGEADSTVEPNSASDDQPESPERET